ncbi:MAG TPA: hypothetical protein PLM24_04230 [Methanothrix sp.]|nr:hypothetical protein [Methanothrix sp.]HPJ84873.1 hypothetical protein [Methanothrix sp.]HPR66325.1 hypothetical protein [Methanothrix sp.]
MKLSLPFMLAITLVVITASAQAQEVFDIYSDLQSCDVTVRGDAAGCRLQVDLSSAKDGPIQTRTLSLDGPGTWIVAWGVSGAEEGPYDVCAKLIKDGEVVSERCKNFYYGGRVDIRFDVRDAHADYRGMTLLVYSGDLAVVDIYYTLIKGDEAVYISKKESVPISGSYGSPSDMSLEWKQLLENGQEYKGRVKIVEKKNGQTRTFMNSFVARDDAEITDTYEDETGASATVMGRSRVPFEGALKFDLYQNGTLLTSVEEKTPILLAGDDETVEISWNGTLDPGIYQLTIQLLGNDGDVIDLEESIIEAEIPPRPSTVETPADDEGSGTSKLILAAAVILAAVVAVVVIRRRRG